MADPLPTPEESKQQQAPQAPVQQQPAVTPTVGKRQAFLDIKRQLTPDEMKEPGTQKLMLELLISTETERDELKPYVEMYHGRDKDATRLEEKIKTNKVNEVMFGVGVGVGCAIIGLAPFFWDDKTSHGPITLTVGLVLTVGFTVGRICFK